VTVVRPIPLRFGTWRERCLTAFTRRSKGPLELHSSVVPRFSDLDRSLPVVLSGVLRGRGIPRQTLERDIARRAAQRYLHGSKSTPCESVDRSDGQEQPRIWPCRILHCGRVASESESRRLQCGKLQGRHRLHLPGQAIPQSKRHNEWQPACRVETMQAQHWRPVQSIQPRRFRTAERASRAVSPPARCRIAARIACAAPRARSNVGSSRIMIEPSLSSVRPGLPRRVTVTLRPCCTALTTWNNCRRARVMESFIATMIPQLQRRGHCGGAYFRYGTVDRPTRLHPGRLPLDSLQNIARRARGEFICSDADLSANTIHCFRHVIGRMTRQILFQRIANKLAAGTFGASSQPFRPFEDVVRDRYRCLQTKRITRMCYEVNRRNSRDVVKKQVEEYHLRKSSSRAISSSSSAAASLKALSMLMPGRTPPNGTGLSRNGRGLEISFAARPVWRISCTTC